MLAKVIVETYDDIETYEFNSTYKAMEYFNEMAEGKGILSVEIYDENNEIINIWNK